LIVVDASLMVAWLLDEPAMPLGLELDKLFERKTLVVPGHWSAEICNALVTNIRRKRVAQSDVDALVDQCFALNILVEPPVPIAQIGPLARLAAAQNLTACDAAYIHIAIERSIPLGTLDNEMRVAAQRLGINVLPS